MNTNTEKLWASPDEIARNEQQPRTHFDADDLQKLSVSLAKRQTLPITVIPHKDAKHPKVKYKIVDGERRWRAAKLAKVPRLWIVLDDEVSSEDDLHETSFAANFCRAGHTNAEAARAIDVQRRAGRTYDEIGALVGKTGTWASDLHSLLQLHPDVLALVDAPTPKAERLPVKLAMALTKFPQDKQMRLWEKNRHRPKAEAFHHIRVAAPTQQYRRPCDDIGYIVGRAATIRTMATGLANLPQSMIGRLSAEQREKAAGALREAAEKAAQTAELLTAAVPEEDEE